jgi:large subunit ribosomal protein L4
MPSATIVDHTGAETGTQELPVLFETPVNQPVMHQALLRQLANARQGTHDTLTRTEVRGGGKKPWAQKGTGRARQGSTRAPQWVGGGIVFGPTPRKYTQGMPRKQRRLALRSALSVKLLDGELTVLNLDGFQPDVPSTRDAVALLEGVEAGRRVLIVLGTHHQRFERSARNIAEVKVLLATNLSVRDLLIADTVLITRDALHRIEEVLA